MAYKSGGELISNLIDSYLGNAKKTLTTKEGFMSALGNVTDQLSDPTEAATSFGPGMAGIIVGPKAKGFANLRQFSDLYSKMPKAEISDAGATLTEALKKRFTTTKAADLGKIEQAANAPEIPAAEIHRQLSDFKGQYPEGPLAAFFNHPELYKQYPELTASKVKFGYGPNSYPGSFHPADQSIELNLQGIQNEGDLMDTILHELQHRVQSDEGFIGGASPNFYKSAQEGTSLKRIAAGKSPMPKGMTKEELQADPSDLYNRTIGEIEARDTTARRTLTDEQRAQHMPYESQGVPVKQGVNPDKWFDTAASYYASTPPALTASERKLMHTRLMERGTPEEISTIMSKRPKPPIVPQDMFESLGLKYKGVTPVTDMPEASKAKGAAHWFDDPETGSTLMMHENDLTPESILFHLLQSRAKFRK